MTKKERNRKGPEIIISRRVPRSEESDRREKHISLKRYQSARRGTEGGNNLEERLSHIKYHRQVRQSKD